MTRDIETKDNLFSRYPEKTLKRFKDFHFKNPHVYQEFKKLAFQMRKTGRTRYSAETIVNVLRWHTDLKTTGDVFEINNDFRSIYCRLLVYNHPEFDGFFEFRSEAKNKGIKSTEQKTRESRNG